MALKNSINYVNNNGHEIEAVGRELRKMMPFIKSKSIQNKC